MLNKYVEYVSNLNNGFEITLFVITVIVLALLTLLLTTAFVFWDWSVIGKAWFARACLIPILTSTPFFYYLYKNK